MRSTPSADVGEGGRIYGSAGAPALIVYQTTERGSGATVATWFVQDIDQVATDLAASGVELIRYDGLEHDALGLTARAGGGRLGWFHDPDGNTFAIESDD